MCNIFLRYRHYIKNMFYEISRLTKILFQKISRPVVNHNSIVMYNRIDFMALGKDKNTYIYTHAKAAFYNLKSSLLMKSKLISIFCC